ncbi:MAG TPA: hypothetical protein PKA88_22935 [Polyangiaceae bacterium]|nr:hypothetical protein [Polyangiaceae bacterium]
MKKNAPDDSVAKRKPARLAPKAAVKGTPARSAEELLRAEREERWEARRLPLMFGGILLLVLVSRVEGLRDSAGRLMGYGFPLMTAFFAIRPFRESALWGASLAIAAGTSVVFLAVLSAGVLPG